MRSIGRNLLHLLPAAVGAAVVFMTQTGPDEAVANFCKWSRKVWTGLPNGDCLHGAPSWALYALASFLIVIGIAWFLSPFLQELFAAKDNTALSGVQPSPSEPTSPGVKPTMLTLFATEHSDGGMVASFGGRIDVRPITESPEWEVPVYYRIIVRLEAHVKFVALYMARNDHLYDVCNSIASNLPHLLDFGADVQVSLPHGSTRVNSADMAFSGLVYIYYDGNLPIEQLVELKKLFESKNAKLQFFISDYAEDRWARIRLGSAPPVPPYEIRNNIVAAVGKEDPSYLSQNDLERRMEGNSSLAFRIRDDQVKQTTEMTPVALHTANQNNSAADMDRPVIVLMDPTQAYDFVWDPPKEMQSLMYLNRKADDAGPRKGGTPTFRIKNIGRESATPVKVSWAVGDVDVIDAVKKSPHLQKYHAIITDTNLGVFTASPDDVMKQVMAVGVQAKSISAAGQAYGMYYARTAKQELPYLAPELNNTVSQEITMPYEIVNFVEIFALASMPENNSAVRPTYDYITVPIFVTISWDIPSGGKPYRYRIDAKIRSSRPWAGSGTFVTEPPEVMALMDFFVTRLDQ